MIVAEPTGLLQSAYTLTDPDGAGGPFGEVALRLFRGGRLTVGDVDYELEPADWTKTSLALVRDGRRVALASRPQLWRRRYQVDVRADAVGLDGDLVLDFAVEGWLGRAWTLTADGLDAGRADWRGGWKPRLDADFSEAVPLVVQAFLVAVAVVERRRSRRNH
ncbi:MAG TPA: hypothetical protein VF576_01320 [Rubricoccaceae bacterium]|jgi:hypothetical protein